MPGADGWRTSTVWPPAGSSAQRLVLRSDGVLAAADDAPGDRSLLALGTGLGRAGPARPDSPALLTWTTAPLGEAIEVVGDIELELDATATAIDTAWIVTLQDVAPDGAVTDVTAGWLRASMRDVDSEHSPVGAPELPCRAGRALVPGVRTSYRIPLVATARRFETGHCLRLVVASDDQPAEVPAIMGFRHAPVGTSSLNTVHSTSRLILPVS